MGNIIFFFLADFILVFQLSFPSIPCPQDSVTTPRTLSFPLPRPFCPGEYRRPSPEARRSGPRTLRPSCGIRTLGPSEHERLSHPVTERSVVQVMEEVAPLLWRLPPVNFPKSSQ